MSELTITIDLDAQRDVIAGLERLAKLGAIERSSGNKATYYYEPGTTPAYGFAVVQDGALTWQAMSGGTAAPWGFGVKVGTPGPERLRLCVERYNRQNRAGAEMLAQS
jgi:hypothetical protein